RQAGNPRRSGLRPLAQPFRRRPRPGGVRIRNGFVASPAPRGNIYPGSLPRPPGLSPTRREDTMRVLLWPVVLSLAAACRDAAPPDGPSADRPAGTIA